MPLTMNNFPRFLFQFESCTFLVLFCILSLYIFGARLKNGSKTWEQQSRQLWCMMMMNLKMEQFLFAPKTMLNLGNQQYSNSTFTYFRSRSSQRICSLCRYVPSRAALPIIRPSLGRQQTIAEKAKVAMQGYLNHFLGNMEIVNSREVLPNKHIDQRAE